MYISKTRFINWTRCPMYFPMDLGNNPSGKADIDAERERREEIIMELIGGITSSDGFEYDEEEFDAKPSEELEALLPYYNQVENEALKVAKKYFSGTFISDSKDVHKQKFFAGCENLKKVVFEKPDVENAFVKLENSAFGKCKSLKQINFPKNVIIEEDAFYGCDSLDTTFLSKGCQK